MAVFSLDEFYPIRSTEQQSRNFRIHEDFLNHIDILPENIHIPDGTVPEARISEYCASYDHSVRKIDLMIIGVGEDGQIGFNEPGSYAKSRTRLVQLTHNTRKIQSGAFFGLENTPKMAITMGIDTIMRAEKIILMAWGEEKAKIVQKVVEGEVISQVPASNLQMHPNIEVVIDENAAQMLTREQTPWLVGPCKWTPKFTRKAVVWLCGVVQKPILKLTYKDYIENSLGELLEQGRAYDQINIDVFNDLQHTITGWPGGKAQRRRFDTPCTVGTVPQARGGILAPPRRRRHLNGRYLYPPRAAGTRRTRSLRNFGQRGRTRRRRAAEHRHGPRTGLRRPLRRGREDHRRQEEGRTRTASAARPQRVPSAAPRHAPPSARSA